MVAVSRDSTASKSPSSLELTEQLSHQQIGQPATTSSSEDLEEGDDEDTRLSRTSSRDQEETATFIDVQLQTQEQHQHKFSFRELAKFFGPGLLTCVAYVVRPELSTRHLLLPQSQSTMLTCSTLQDPGNLEADLQAGGFAGYALLWLFLWCTIMVSLAAMMPSAACNSTLQAHVCYAGLCLSMLVLSAWHCNWSQSS